MQKNNILRHQKFIRKINISSDNIEKGQKKRGLAPLYFSLSVIMLGFEPRTPALKGQCSTS